MSDGIWLVEEVLSADECAELVARIDALGPSAAPVTTARGFVMRPDIRNNERVMFDDVALAQRLFERVRAALPATIDGREAVGANERFRCYRYQPGQYFRPHADGAFRRSVVEQSELTLMVYLNQPTAGGDTAFPFSERVVSPRTGRALVFRHQLLHESRDVVAGRKYVLRSDVMYRAPA